MLLLVCAAQAWLMWRFIHSQLRHWREHWSEQSAKRRVPTAPRLAARLIKRESGECWVRAGWGGWGPPPGPWTGPAPAPSHLLPGPGLLSSCQGLTGMWPGAHGLWVGLADVAGALTAAVGRAAAGWGALAGSMSTGWPRGPYQGRLMLSGSSPAPMLRISAWPSPRMLALPLSSGVA